MRREINEVKMNVEKFFSLLQNYPDDFDTTLVFVKFLRSFFKGEELEKGLLVTEFITLIKEHKPNVFRLMRRLSEEDSLCAFLTGISMDLHQAESRLQSIYEGKRVEY